MSKKGIIRLVTIVLAVLMPVLTVTAVFAETEAGTQGAQQKVSKYASPDINALTGLGEEPEELSVSAGTQYMEKAWYEYVMYSDKAVSSYRINDDTRLLFYDPYTYTNSMIMDVQFDAGTTEFDTMSSYTVSKTNKKSISSCVSSTETNTLATQTSGRDETGTEVENGGSTKTIYNHSLNDEVTGTKKEVVDYEYGLYLNEDTELTESVKAVATATTEAGTTVKLTGPEATASVSASVSEEISAEVKVGVGTEWLLDQETKEVVYSDDYKTTTYYTGEDTVEYETTSSTKGWTQLSARVTSTLGSSSSTSTSWTEEESVTVSKTYVATHFASDGITPLPWAIVHYEVKMPMKTCMQVKHSGEWVTVSTTYCLMTTVKGTCRAWMQNGQVYYEDWGSGEPVVEEAFWANFMTKDQLMNAYSNTLLPVGGTADNAVNGNEPGYHITPVTGGEG